MWGLKGRLSEMEAGKPAEKRKGKFLLEVPILQAQCIFPKHSVQALTL